MREVRGFTRGDRDQLTRLVNAHIAAVMPGWSVPVATLLAAAHLKRYGDDDRVGTYYRNAGEIAWIVCWPAELDAAAGGANREP